MRKLKTDDMQRKIDMSVSKRGEKAAQVYLDTKQYRTTFTRELIAAILFSIGLIGLVVGLLAM
jgi:hypothetical protein